MIDSTVNIAQYAIVGAMVFILIAALGIFIVFKLVKRREGKNGSKGQAATKSQDLPQKTSKVTSTSIPRVIAETIPKVIAETVPKKVDKKELIFTKVGSFNGERDFKMMLEDSLTVGRGAGKNDWVIANDQTVSYKHCKIYLEKGKVYVVDLNTTNGTYINKQRIIKPAVLNNQDIIQMGASEYKLTIIS